MRIELHEIPIKDVTNGYTDNEMGGVTGMNGKLDIRPSFQREYIYKGKQREEVIRTVCKGFPLNVMYWAKRSDGGFEVMDGQQRTISICQYVQGDFSIGHRGFPNLTEEEQEQILNYPLMVYICDGTDKEKLEWFKIINIAGEELTQQELRNAIYTGEWLNDAKKYFSRPGCPAQKDYASFLSGSAIRQNYLETALRWISSRNGEEIEDYMAAHQHDTNCTELWLYFQGVMSWVKTLFPNYRKEMEGIEWGLFYNKCKENSYDPAWMEDRIVELMEDDDVTKNSGVYGYLLDGDERHLNIRTFSPKMARAAYERQGGICPVCGGHFELEEMQADHITPWSEGGKTVSDNCQMLCADCNRRKSNK